MKLRSHHKLLISVIITLALSGIAVAATAPILRSYPPGTWQSTAVKLAVTTTAVLLGIYLYRRTTAYVEGQ